MVKRKGHRARSIDDVHAESAVRRAVRDFRGFATNSVRFLVWAAAVNVVVVGCTVWLSWGHGKAASIVIGVGALVVGSGLAFLLPLTVFFVKAPYQQRNVARHDLEQLRATSEQEKEALRAELVDARSAKRIQKVAPLFGTELREIRTRIEKAKTGGSYPANFTLPGFMWHENAAELTDDRDIYAKVERAYTAAHHVNENVEAREAKRRPGNRIPTAVQPQDGLDEAHGAAGEALDALGEHHNQPYQTPAQRAARALLDDAVGSGEIEPEPK